MAPVPYNGQYIEDDAFRVLVTGFGPFGRHNENPSWLAVRELHNTILYVDPPSEPIPVAPVVVLPAPPHHPQPPPKPEPIPIDIDRDPRQIHITAKLMPVIYQTVLDEAPGWHARPPTLVPTDELGPSAPPPEEGYDFVLHVGVAGRGALRIERRGHKMGYEMRDITGVLPPVVAKSELTDQEKVEREMSARHAAANMEKAEEAPPEMPNFGFGEGYEKFPAELETDIDVPRLIRYLKDVDIERVYSSMDAGHYLCDFIFFASLAEALRTSSPEKEKDEPSPDTGRATKVLFVHCPPVNQPLSTEEVREALKRIVVWVCSSATR